MRYRITFNLLLIGLFLSPISFIFAQNKGELKEYNRSALATMVIYHSEDEFGRDIMEAFNKVPMPDKYDDQSFGVKVLYNDSITGVQRNKKGLIKAQYGKALTSADVRKN